MAPSGPPNEEGKVNKVRAKKETPEPCMAVVGEKVQHTSRDWYSPGHFSSSCTAHVQTCPLLLQIVAGGKPVTLLLTSE